MAIARKELIKWLKGLDCETVWIDEGGLSLVSDESHELEVGGEADTDEYRVLLVDSDGRDAEFILEADSDRDAMIQMLSADVRQTARDVMKVDDAWGEAIERTVWWQLRHETSISSTVLVDGAYAYGRPVDDSASTRVVVGSGGSEEEEEAEEDGWTEDPAYDQPLVCKGLSGQQILQELVDRRAITQADCLWFFGRGDSDPYVVAAREHHKDGELEVDDRPVVSDSPAGGAYVSVWLWISDSEAGVAKDYEKGTPAYVLNQLHCMLQETENGLSVTEALDAVGWTLQNAYEAIEDVRDDPQD